MFVIGFLIQQSTNNPSMIILISNINKVLAENFVERGGGHRQAGACQVRQQSYTEFSATDVKGFYLKLVLIDLSLYSNTLVLYDSLLNIEYRV